MPEPRCPFCAPDAHRVFHTGRLILGLWDAFPVSSGHALLIPKRHVAGWFDATVEERCELLDAVDVVRENILALQSPDGFNIGVNIGEAAGQTVFHLHVHVIPRYRGDVPHPRGGIRHVIPAKADYLPDLAGRVMDQAAPYGRASDRSRDSVRLATGGEDVPLLTPLLDDMDRASRMDIAVAFVLPSGVALIESHLRDALDRNATVRFLTGDYMDATDPDALRRLLDLEGEKTQFRIFEARTQTFHPKAYIFGQTTRAGVAYVGSSNLTRPALTHGIEWNYRLTAAEDPLGFAAVSSAFERLFSHPATRPLDAAWIDDYARRRSPLRPATELDIAPEPAPVPPEPNTVQMEAILALERTRLDGNSSGLVVLGTGMGKTYLAALDSARPEYRRILFVAHREEILAQAMHTFRMKRLDAHFGHYTGTDKDPEADVLFASIQTLGRVRHLQSFDPHVFDYIVIDEFHHASAQTYRRVIDYFRPKFLLGLTATPERTDGGDLLALCQENLVYRCDFFDGIRRGLLCPFHYFGVPDDVDYANIPWRNSRFDEAELTNAVATQSRAQNALDQYREKAGQRTLAFCCSTRHADFMAEFFRDNGIRVAVVHSGPDADPRATSLERLRDGGVDVIFAVDMFNEGVDVPAIDTVMMLRPTESAVVWLQQFGRGLRQAPGKDHLRVIDYIGNHRTFLIKPQTLLQIRGASDAQIDRVLNLLQTNSFELPPGCEVTYDLRTINIIRDLLRLRGGHEALRLYYEDFREGHGTRPRAVEAFHDGYLPRSAARSHGSWIRFVNAMGDLSPQHQEILRQQSAFLDAIESTPMTKSYKMLVLLSMLNEDALPGEIRIERLADQFRQLAQRSARLRDDIGTAAMEDPAALQTLIESNPIEAWVGGKGTGGVRYFSYEKGVFRTTKALPDALRSSLQDLVREVVDWRLAEYLLRGTNGESDRFVCKVSHADKRPILFLPDRERNPDLPMGTTVVSIDGELYEADFVKVALNVVRRQGSDTNELPAILRRWFGPRAGVAGTDFRVVLERQGNGYVLVPLGRTAETTLPEVSRPSRTRS